jgi:peptidoglycan hydrolase CwlO-like protein
LNKETPVPLISTEAGWRLDRGIGMALIGGFLLQFAYVVSWGTALATRVDAVERNAPATSAEIAKLEGAREDATRAIQKLTDSVDALSHMLDERTKRFDWIDKRLGQAADTLDRIERAQAARPTIP